MLLAINISLLVSIKSNLLAQLPHRDLGAWLFASKASQLVLEASPFDFTPSQFVLTSTQFDFVLPQTVSKAAPFNHVLA
jgi:hypothetical protein